MHPLLIQNEELLLLPERGIYWPAQQILIVSDIHWGKAHAFRKSYIHLPQGTTSTDLERLSDMIDSTGARQVIFLGDLFHSKDGKDGKTLKLIHAWRSVHKNIDITLVRGNHDLSAGDPPDELTICCVNEPLILSPFSFTHHPLEKPGIFYNLCGHIHPAVRLTGSARQSMSLPCFYFGKYQGILPSFGSFTGSSHVNPKKGEKAFVIAENRIIEFSRASS